MANPRTQAPPPLPTPALDYFRPAMAIPANWLTLTIVANPGQWHHTRAALTRANIQCQMAEGIPVVIDEKGRSMKSFALLVPQADLPRAAAILEAMKSGREWCPRCGSTDSRRLPMPWWWLVIAIPFLGVPPYSPPRLECKSCGNKWE
jgi:hypothetical protein